MILDGGPVEIVGVMPNGVDFPRGAEFWAPIVPALVDRHTAQSSTPRHARRLLRRRAAASVARHDRRADRRRRHRGAPRCRARPAGLKWGTTAVVTPFVDYVFGPVRPALRVLWAAVIVLLLIACANVSGLMLTRVSRRRQEHSIRLALGATPRARSPGRGWPRCCSSRSPAAALGLALAHWIAKAIVSARARRSAARRRHRRQPAGGALHVRPRGVRRRDHRGGAAPKQAGRASLLDTLEGERTTSGRAAMRARSAFLVAQIALSVVLLVAAGLVLRSFMALSRVDLGFSPDRVLSLTVQPQGTKLPPNVWLDGFLERVRTLPGVESAGAVYLRPLMLGPIGQGVAVRLEGQPEVPAGNNPEPDPQPPDRDARVLRGDEDSAAARAVLHRPRHPGRAACGDRRRVDGAPAVAGAGSDRQAAGLVELHAWRTAHDVANGRRRGERRALSRHSRKCSSTSTTPRCRPAVRPTTSSSAPPAIRAALAPAIRALARELDPASTVDAVTTLDAVVERAAAPRRLTMWLFVTFAGLAFGLAALGLFSVVALDVSHRAREFAIRMALGATRQTILRRRARARGRHGSSVGLGLGLAGAAVASRGLRGLLFGVAPR